MLALQVSCMLQSLFSSSNIPTTSRNAEFGVSSSHLHGILMTSHTQLDSGTCIPICDELTSFTSYAHTYTHTHKHTHTHTHTHTPLFTMSAGNVGQDPIAATTAFFVTSGPLLVTPQLSPECMVVFCILSHNVTPRISWRHLIWNVLSFCRSYLDIFHVSAPYSRTGITRVLQVCNLVSLLRLWLPSHLVDAPFLQPYCRFLFHFAI